MAPVLDAVLLRGWARAATSALERHRARIDEINVFPVPDGDTGTNLLLTMRAAADSVRRGLREARVAVTEETRATAEALAHGALLGARGNSGVVLSQVLRGVAEAVADADGPDGSGGDGAGGGTALTDALARADRLARAAISRPREGTVLTVLAAAAAAARATGSDRLDEVAVAAATAAGSALRATTGQLPELARAGVVDAGGLGLYLVLDALAALAAGRPPATELPGAGARGRAALTAVRESGSPEFDYEVMYLLDGSDEARVTALRTALDRLGDAVAIVAAGPDGPWNVHVHCTDIGAALEAGLAAGRPHRVTVARFADRVPAAASTRPRAVLAVVTGAGAAALARAAGADVLEPTGPAGEAELATAVAGTGAGHVLLLPCDRELTAVAERVAAAARADGREVVVVPTASVPQCLAALAVHDPERRADDDAVAMAEAAAATRTGTLQVAEAEALTWAGPCRPGEVLGFVDGEVVLIAPDLAVGAVWLARRMLSTGGELVTALLGAGADGELGWHLAEELRRSHPEVDVAVHRGGQPDGPLVLGVE